MTAMEEILAERRRQITVEGWSQEHDDTHDRGELLSAAVCYLGHAQGRPGCRTKGPPVGWPWDAAWWKPKDRRRDLVRAGALLLAEGERIARRNRGAPWRDLGRWLAMVVAELDREAPGL